MKKFIKKNKFAYKLFLVTREKLRIVYNVKTRSRFFWNLNNGDNSLSLDYPLDSKSVVFDIGAYEGNFTKKIYKKFKCNIYAFEPLEKYSEKLKKTFQNDLNVRIYNFGLLDEDKVIKLSNIDGASSIFSRPEGELNISVTMKSFVKFIEENSINKIDFLYMNIEGSEYKLLSQIIESGFISNINHLQVQFHNFVEGSKKLRKEIRKELRKTHKCKFNYPFIWERWDKLEVENL
tara:strand:+ start:371 stop:1072 length:702 start_codon:yes stop_codon:yes gene_type:complete